MGIESSGLQKLIDIVTEHPQGMISVQEAIELIGGVGVQWKLICRVEHRREEIVLLVAEPDVGVVELRIEMPHGTQQVALDKACQIAPRTWERRGSFEWLMDRFDLALSYGGQQEAITVFGPYMAVLARGYLKDETIPSIAVHELATAIAQLITGETIDLSSINAIGSGFRARQESEKALAVLTKFLRKLCTQDAESMPRPPAG